MLLTDICLCNLHWFQWDPHSALPEHLHKFLTSCLPKPGHIKILRYIKIIAVASNIVVQWKTSWFLCVFCNWDGTDFVSGYSEKCHTHISTVKRPCVFVRSGVLCFRGKDHALGTADRIPDPAAARVLPRRGHAGAAWDRWWTRPLAVRAFPWCVTMLKELLGFFSRYWVTAALVSRGWTVGAC